MAPVQDVVAHSIELKQELVTFLRDRRIAREYEDALDEEFGDDEPDDDDLIDFRDEFLLEYRMSDDRTPVERFVRSRGDLPRADRDLLLSWKDPWDSVFEVVAVEEGVLHVTNLVDEMPYRVHSPEADVRSLGRGDLVGLRIVPVGEEWLLTGSVLTVPEDELLLKSAAAEALTHEESECRNEAHRSEAREIQRRERDVFLDHFGTDFLVVRGAELPVAMAGFWAALGRPWQVDLEAWPKELLELPQVALAYDAVDGLTFYEDYAVLNGAFEGDAPTPDDLETVGDYVEDVSVSPQLVVKAAEAHPERRDAVLAAALDRPSFSWERDGEAMLRDYKPDYVAGAPRPAVSIVPERLRPYLEAPDVARIHSARI